MDFTFGDGILTSIFSMLIVFLILVLLAAVISLFRYIKVKDPAPAKKSARQPQAAKPAASAPAQAATSDGALIAMLTATCVAEAESGRKMNVLSVSPLN